MNRLLLYLILFGLCFAGVAYTQEFKPIEYRYSIEEGLPSSECYHVIQGPEGYIWIASDNGISRFDGTSFKNYSINDGLVSNTILKFFVDHKQRIWCQSWVSALCYIEHEKIVPYQYNKILSDSLGSLIREIQIHYDKQNVLHVFSDYGYCTIDDKGKFTWIDYIKPQYRPTIIPQLLVIKEIEGKCYSYLAYNKPIKKDHIDFKIRIDGVKKFEHVWNYNSTPRVKYVCRLGENYYLIYDDRLLQINQKGYQIKTYPKSLTIAQNIREKLFIGITQNGGELNGKQLISNESYSSYCKDDNGGIWISSLENGILYQPNLPIKSASKSNPKTILSSNRSLYLGYENGKIERYYENQIFSSQIEHPNFLKLSKMVHNPSGGSPYFLCFAKAGLTKDSTLKHPVNWAKNLYILNDSITYGVHYSTIVKYKNSKSVTTYVADKFDSYTSCVWFESRLFICGNSGLYVLQNGTIVPSPNPEFKNTRIHQMCVIDDQLLIALEGKGLYLLKQGKVIPCDANPFRKSVTIREILRQGDNIWIISNAGVAMLNWKAGKLRLISSYNNLMFRNFESATLHEGKLIIAMNRGLYQIDLDNKFKALEARTKLKSWTMNGTPVSVQRQKFTANENNMSFQLIALDFTQQGQLLYQHKLEGTGENWDTSNQTQINYKNLASGTYRFLFRYQLSDGRWSKINQACHFVITPPFYRSTWFLSLILLSLLLLTYLIYHSIKQKIKTKERLTLIRSEVLRSQMNSHFVFNSLNSIRGYIIANQQSLADQYIVRFSRLIRQALEYSSQTAITLEEELGFIDNYLFLEHLRAAGNFSYHIERNNAALDFQIPALILQPLVENAILHGISSLEKNGLIVVKCRQEQTHLIIDIIDNGKGFGANSDQINTHQSMGLQMIIDRIQLVNAENKLEIIQSKHETVLRLILKKNKDD